MYIYDFPVVVGGNQEDSAFQFLAQELSLLSHRAGQVSLYLLLDIFFRSNSYHCYTFHKINLLIFYTSDFIRMTRSVKHLQMWLKDYEH